MPRIKRFNQESQAWEYVDQNTIPEINITHETGSSENKLMSQKIVTDELNKKQEKGNYALKSDLPTKTSELINDSGFVDTGLGIENATVGQIVRIKAVDDLGNPTKLEAINSPNAVLYNTQTLTPEQQEQARKNIGAEQKGLGITGAIVGQIAKIKAVKNGVPTEWESGVGGEIWELIEEITVEAGISAVERNVNLKSIRMAYEMQPAEKPANLEVVIRFEGASDITKDIFESITNGIGTEKKKSSSSVERIGETMSHIYTQVGGASYWGQGVKICGETVIPHAKIIESIRIRGQNGTTLLPEGSVIKIWGVRNK